MSAAQSSLHSLSEPVHTAIASAVGRYFAAGGSPNPAAIPGQHVMERLHRHRGLAGLAWLQQRLPLEPGSLRPAVGRSAGWFCHWAIAGWGSPRLYLWRCSVSGCPDRN